MQTPSEDNCFGGSRGVYRHDTDVCRCEMAFGRFLPEEASEHSVPMLWHLSGLTCTHDSTLLMRRLGFDGPVPIDQRTEDPFLDDLRPGSLAMAMVERRQNGQIGMQPGYDHSDFFVASFVRDHIAFHAEALHA